MLGVFFVTYSSVRNSQTTTAHPSPLPAHSVATPDMAASPAHTLTIEKHHILSPTQEKQDKLNVTLLVTIRVDFQCRVIFTCVRA